ncbi:MAG: LamG domain-containing protein [Lentisphaerae bacterium]|nr:LamG domain-containing protein [Lentisphaerota bacterium]
MSIAAQIIRIQQAKSALKSAINARGGALGDELLDHYAAAVTALPAGEGTELPFITASADDILEGKVGAGVDGKPIYGNIPVDIELVSVDNEVYIKKGYYSADYTVAVPAAEAVLSGNVVTVPTGYHWHKTLTVEEMAEPTVSANVVTIPVGYNKTLKTKTIAEAGELSISGNKVTCPAGYVKSVRTAEIPEAQSPTVNGHTVTIYPGYVSEEQTVEISCTGNISGGMEFFKCAAVYGPRDVTCFVISGCPNAAVNGTYLPTEFTVEDFEGTKQPVYKNTASSYYYYFTFDGWGVSTDYNNSAEYMGGVGSSWMDRDWMPIDGMSCTESTTTIDLDVPKTWDGYKAVLSNGIYNFENELTTGLSWADVKPEILKVYSADVSVKIASLPRDYPTDKLVFYAPLCGDVTATEVGGTLKNRNVSLETVGGIQAARFVPTATLNTTAPLPIDCKDGSGEFSVFFCINPSAVINEAIPLFIGYSGNSNTFFVKTKTDGGSMFLEFLTENVRVPFTVDTWYTFTAVRRGTTYYVYNGKTLFGSTSYNGSLDNPQLVLGAREINDSRYNFNGYMRNILIYNRALNEAEITQLNDKFAIA